MNVEECVLSWPDVVETLVLPADGPGFWREINFQCHAFTWREGGVEQTATRQWTLYAWNFYGPFLGHWELCDDGVVGVHYTQRVRSPGMKP